MKVRNRRRYLETESEKTKLNNSLLKEYFTFNALTSPHAAIQVC